MTLELLENVVKYSPDHLLLVEAPMDSDWIVKLGCPYFRLNRLLNMSDDYRSVGNKFERNIEDI